MQNFFLPLYRSAIQFLEESSTDAWNVYTTEEFQAIRLEDHEDTESLASLGHGFVKHPPDTILNKVEEFRLLRFVIMETFCVTSSSLLASLVF